MTAGEASAHSPAERFPAGLVVAVDDEPAVLRAVQTLLLRAGYETRCFDSAAMALEALRSGTETVDLLLSDLYMEGVDGLELLREVRAEWPDMPVIIMTGRGTVQSAVEAMRSGAYDFLVKPFEPLEGLVAAVDRAIAHRRLVQRARALEQKLVAHERFEGIVGTSPAIRRLLALIESVSASDATVLVVGETGTGKELVARAIHRRSPRSGRAFVAINCGALTESVLESELFGHVRGAFTGASSARQGLFEEANGGTIFLDEVGELSPATQVRLLRVLQEGEVRRVGSNQPRNVDVRVIAATHRDLSAEVASGKFREDLFYRLNVVGIRVPPLRERREDIPQLLSHFVQKYAPDGELRITPDALGALTAYDWPGNVRQLENALQRAVILADGVLGPELFAELDAEAPQPESRREKTNAPPVRFAEARDMFERDYFRALLEQTGGNLAEAARLAGLDPSNLRRSLRRHGIDRRSYSSKSV